MKDTNQFNLCPKQVQIMELLAEGLSNTAIATHLDPPVSENVVKQHLYRIYQLIEVHNRIEAVNKWKNV